MMRNSLSKYTNDSQLSLCNGICFNRTAPNVIKTFGRHIPEINFISTRILIVDIRASKGSRYSQEEAIKNVEHQSQFQIIYI